MLQVDPLNSNSKYLPTLQSATCTQDIEYNDNHHNNHNHSHHHHDNDYIQINNRGLMSKKKTIVIVVNYCI